ncbi:MAG TPA: hypothetical protein VF103_19140, partial [Polyangiaceae bacterium]
MSRRSNGSRRALAKGAIAASMLFGATQLSAEGLDPKLPLPILTGRPPAFERLPDAPAVAWQARLLEPLLAAPLADQGALVVAHASGLVVDLDASGRTKRTVRAGSSLALGPVLLTGRRRLVVTGDAEAVLLLPSGRIEARRKLPFRDVDANALALATTDGGALLGSGARFARLGATGSLTAGGSLRESLRGLFEWRGLSVLVERGGRVLGLGHAGDPYELRNLGRPVRACELRGDRLYVLAGERELVELDLDKNAERTLFSDPPLVPRGIFILPNGELRIASSSNVVVALDAAGRETFRVAQPSSGGDSTITLLGDSRGSMLVATGGLDLRLVGESGDALEIPGTACPDPLAPVPVSKSLVVASCRSGVLFGISG